MHNDHEKLDTDCGRIRRGRAGRKSCDFPGAFTRDAWEGYVESAIKEAANSELQSTDWVLKTQMRTTFPSMYPEQIQKALDLDVQDGIRRRMEEVPPGNPSSSFRTSATAVKQMNRQSGQLAFAQALRCGLGETSCRQSVAGE